MGNDPRRDGPREPLPLDDDEVHVWHLRLDTAFPNRSVLLGLLSEDERAKAARFHFEKGRLEFSLTRAILRRTLEAYGVAEASSIRFDYELRGKPRLSPEHGNCDLRFNVSHSHGVALIAVARGHHLGVDVETIRDNKERDGIIRRFFAEEEQAEYWALPVDDRPRGFFLGWTRKEAFIKAIGVGLGYPLDSFAVTLTPGSPARFVRLDADPDGVEGWTLTDLSIEPSYVAALAVRASGLRIINRIYPASPGGWAG